MIKGIVTSNGKRFVILGLSILNLDRLKDNDPILFPNKDIGLNGTTIIMYGDTIQDAIDNTNKLLNTVTDTSIFDPIVALTLDKGTWYKLRGGAAITHQDSPYSSDYGLIIYSGTDPNSMYKELTENLNLNTFKYSNDVH